jgi:type VII secretion integral membrane protein EccD
LAAPRRRVDVALPAQVPVADLLPGLLQHAGEALADDGESHGGWVLRKVDGAQIESGRPLSAQVRDGDVVHLVPARDDWPEPDYDDIADAIASSSRRHVRAWGGAATLAFGLAATGAVLAVGLYAIVAYRPDRLLGGALALGVATLLTLLGVVLARAVADVQAGSVLAVYALPYAFVGGLLILAVDEPLSGLTAAHFLAGSAALLVFSVFGYVGIAASGRLFVGGGLAGLFGMLGAVLAVRLFAAGAAAVLVTGLVAAVVGFPLLAMRLGKLPMPVVPQGPADLASDAPPARAVMYAAVARADELLTGLLFGAAAVHVVGAALLLPAGVSGVLLAGVVAVVNLLRARLFVTVRQRLPLLLAGTLALVILGLGGLAGAEPVTRLLVGLGGVLVVGGAVLACAVTYSRRPPSPYLGRAAEILDIVLILTVVPVACSVLGLFGWVRGLGG